MIEQASQGKRGQRTNQIHGFIAIDSLENIISQRLSLGVNCGQFIASDQRPFSSREPCTFWRFLTFFLKKFANMQQLTIVQANTVLFIGESSVEIIPKTGLFSGESSVEEIISKNRFVYVRFRFSNLGLAFVNRRFLRFFRHLESDLSINHRFIF